MIACIEFDLLILLLLTVTWCQNHSHVGEIKTESVGFQKTILSDLVEIRLLVKYLKWIVAFALNDER